MATVAHIIAVLNKYYSPEDELIIAYWDKDTTERLSRPMTNDQWSELVDNFESGEEGIGEQFANDINWVIENEMNWDEPEESEDA